MTTAAFSSRPPNTVSGVVTSWLPITTEWPILTACATAYVTNGGVAVLYDPSLGVSNTPLLKCLPPEATLWWEQGIQTPLLTVTSLGPLVCPGAYTTATQIEINSLTTEIACCPSSYTFSGIQPYGTVGECVSTLTSGNSFTYEAAPASTGPWATISTIWGSQVGSVNAIPLNGFIFAQATAPPNSSPASATISSSSSVTVSTPTGSPSGSASSGDLSPGAKAGIGVGVALGILGIACALGSFFYISRHRRKVKSLTLSGGEGGIAMAAAGQGGMEAVSGTRKMDEPSQGGANRPVPQPNATPLYEMDNQEPVVVPEMDSATPNIRRPDVKREDVKYKAFNPGS
ncbi:hypothetical protein G7Y89_g12561 [Cudoniella acicularis]|uniref:Uncharacterized protein n=1 Tax=Cudoniella acicularis TaxID=354080 RepID=A0A8H4VZJ2_9HELO|nr:hypothetical protein G7Y89_g12561 [Cudoniella acicularis]